MVGPLVEDGAMYSGISEIHFSTFLVATSGKTSLKNYRRRFSNCSTWAYGPPENSSEPRTIKGSIMLAMESAQGNIVNFRHLVIQGDSQWIIGGNILSFCNNMHLSNELVFLNGTSLPTYAENNLCYMPAKVVRLGAPSPLITNSDLLAKQSLQAQIKLLTRYMIMFVNILHSRI